MRKYILSVLCLLFAFLAGCDKSYPDKKIEPQSFQKISFSNNATEVAAFTVSLDSDLYVIEIGGLLTRYKSDGTIIQEYEGTGDFTAMCWNDGVLYAYDAVKHQIVRFNIENGENKVIAENFEVDEVLKLVKAGEYLYALAVPDAHGNIEPGLNGYIDFGEILYQINIKTGAIKDTKEDKIIAIYCASDGTLYYYAYRDDVYALFYYNTKNGESTKLYDLSDAGYISAFVYEGDYFVCSDLENANIKVIRLNDGMEEQLADKLLVISGNDMTYLYGNIIYFGYYADGKPNSFNSKYLGDINMHGQSDIAVTSDNADNSDSSTGIAIKDKGKIVVSTSLRAYINPAAVKQISGISTRIVDQSVHEEALLAEIMAGNPDVDIYITSSGGHVATGVKDKNIYIPLGNSEVIRSYMDKCFDYVADAMRSPSDDIWMLPLTLDGTAIWYVPENTEEFSINLEEFRYLDDFLSLSERMPKTGSYAAYVDYAGSFAILLHNQYDIAYNDFKGKTVNYNTPLYKDIFDKMWTGWVNYSQNPRHPLFRDSRDDYKGELISESTPFDKSKLIYKWSSIGDHLNMSGISLEGWRVLPMPRITSEVKGNAVGMRCAFINPYSKNKELALEYLEAITKVPFDFNSANSAALLFKDKTMYADCYDISQPAFEDIYHIMQEGMLVETGFYLNGDIVDDYQNGRLSLDEAVAAIQREAEMWLNE